MYIVSLASRFIRFMFYDNEQKKNIDLSNYKMWRFIKVDNMESCLYVDSLPTALRNIIL